jgi:guanosine-diphosphatase
MIDAGSTGSRIHVYRFNNCGPTPELENEVFKMTEKKSGGSGLSSYDADAEGAAKSLDVLMDVAMETVPDKLKACTPVAVKATAGLRLLGPEKSQQILDAVRTRLETVYPFPVVSKEQNGVVIMDGKDEGVYAWITTNYLLGKIGGPDHTETAAVFDLGGGSTQIVFEPTFKSASHGMPEKLSEGDHKYQLKFGGREFELYQHSHLGYGLMSARQSIHRTLIEDLHLSNPSDSDWVAEPVINPCIAPGMSRPVQVKLSEGHALGDMVSVNMTGPSSPAPAQCRKLAEKILVKDAECALAPCSFNGVHQPSLEKTFAREDVYTFSYFFDRTDPLGMPESFTLKELHRLTDQVCGGEASWDMFEGVPGAIGELKGRPEHCLDLNFMMALLHTGYEMPIDREVKIAKKIKGNELGWCLGARYIPYLNLIIYFTNFSSLPLLSQNSGWQCRIKEVA